MFVFRYNLSEFFWHGNRGNKCGRMCVVLLLLSDSIVGTALAIHRTVRCALFVAWIEIYIGLGAFESNRVLRAAQALL